MIRHYQKSKWVKKVGNRAYKLYDDQIDIFSATQAIQKQLGKDIRIGGKSSFSLLGYSHYLSQQNETVYLFGNYREKLPSWFTKYDWETNYKYSAANLFDLDLSEFVTDFTRNDLIIKISSPELALFEMLYLIPLNQGFQEAFLIVVNDVFTSKISANKAGLI